MSATFPVIICRVGTLKPTHRVTELHTALENLEIGQVRQCGFILRFSHRIMVCFPRTHTRTTMKDYSTILPNSVRVGIL